MMPRTRRPALQVVVLYAAGILAGYNADPPIGLLLVLAALLLGLSLVLRRRRTVSISYWLLAAAFFLVACLQHEVFSRNFPSHHILNYRDAPDPVVIQGRVISDPVRKDKNATLILEATAIDHGTGTVRTCGKIWLTVRDFTGQLAYGDQVRIQGRLRVPSQARNPGEFDYRAYLARRSIHVLMTLRPESIQEVSKESVRWPMRVVRLVRRHLNRTIDRTLKGSPGALLRGVLLGERRKLPAEVTEAFSDSGVIHVLAVSGLHVGLIVGIFYSLFCALRLRETAATLLTLTLIFLYMFVVDLRPSVVRATIMASVIMVGRLLERESDLLNAIAFAGLIILIWNPLFLFELGFQLSFVATLSIVYLHGRLKELLLPFLKATSPPWARWICSGLLVSLSAQLGTFPIIAYYFQKAPIISIVANLLVVPLIGLAVSLGFTSALLSLVSMGLARMYAAANWVLLTGLIRLVSFAASLPFAYLHIPRPSKMFISLYYVFLFLGANGKRFPAARRTFLFGGLILLNFLVWDQALERPGDLSVLFLDVGQGDAAFVRFPNGRTMLVDGGERKPRFDCGERIICPYLRRIGLQHLDVMVLTHADNDHVGGLPAVLEEFPVGLVLDSRARHITKTYCRFLELAHAPGVVYREVRAGDRLKICPEVEVTVLHPTEEFVTEDGDAPFGRNSASVVLRIKYGMVSFLLTGDIEEEAEEALLEGGCELGSTVLKVPHHGSKSSSILSFVRAVQPQVAVISVGRWNRFGHPGQEVLQRYQQFDVALYRTDQDGAVAISTDGRRLELETVLGEKRRWTVNTRRPTEAR